MTDEKILDLYFERSELAIEKTREAYGDYVRFIAFAILSDKTDAADIENDTYLKAWNSMPPERHDPLKPYLGGVSRNLAINRLEYKYAAKRAPGEYALSLDELAECIPAENSDPTDMLALRDLIDGFLEFLDSDTRRMFLRRYYYVSSIAEIARDMRMSESKVKMRLMRARKELYELLIKSGFILE